MTSKKDKKTTEKKPLTKTMSDKLFAKYFQSAIEFFDLRFLEMPMECDDCGEPHHHDIHHDDLEDVFLPRMIGQEWESYMGYDLPEPEEMKELIRANLEDKIDELVDYSAHMLGAFFEMEQKRYPEFRAEKLEKETAKAQLTKDLSKEQWDLIYKAYPSVKAMEDHAAKHNTDPIKTEIAIKPTTDYELN